ncbi:MAG: VRR-NUC domain-containing protein [Lachnospiraceae bacterium]|nr:VRR-NUC domain-containing protein [Lachnospiraceae bacterium]
MLERDVEKNLRIQAKAIGCRCMKFVSPGTAGVPDRIVLIPGGHIVFVELKAPKKKERALQLIIQDRLRAMGFTVFSSVDGTERIQEVIDYCKEVMTDGKGLHTTRLPAIRN